MSFPPVSISHLKELIKLRQKKFRIASGLTLAEGWRVLNQLLNNDVEIEEILINDTENIDVAGLKAKNIYSLTAAQMGRIATVKEPQSVCCILKTRNITLGEPDFILYLDRIKDPGNLGTIIRTAAAAGVGGIVCSPDCCELFNPKVIRASLGTVFSIPFAEKTYEWLTSSEYIIMITRAQTGENILQGSFPEKRIALVLGSEAFGISAEIQAHATRFLSIPMQKNIESLNVSAAAAVCIYSIQNSRIR